MKKNLKNHLLLNFNINMSLTNDKLLYQIKDLLFNKETSYNDIEHILLKNNMSHDIFSNILFDKYNNTHYFFDIHYKYYENNIKIITEDKIKALKKLSPFLLLNHRLGILTNECAHLMFHNSKEWEDFIFIKDNENTVKDKNIIHNSFLISNFFNKNDFLPIDTFNQQYQKIFKTNSHILKSKNNNNNVYFYHKNGMTLAKMNYSTYLFEAPYYCQKTQEKTNFLKKNNISISLKKELKFWENIYEGLKKIHNDRMIFFYLYQENDLDNEQSISYEDYIQNKKQNIFSMYEKHLLKNNLKNKNISKTTYNAKI